MVKARKILYPFSVLYGGVMRMRNKLYDLGLLSSSKFDIPVIAVGNLSLGGTGKSPMIEYLIRLLHKEYRLATLSRGYKRSSKGFLLVGKDTSAEKAGDEPLQFKQKYPEVLVSVDENRKHGIQRLLEEEYPPEVVLLDDAMQHRKVRADLYILLTPYGRPYSEDLILPAGNLREPVSGARRAQIVVVTKCPDELRPEEKERLRARLKLASGQQLFFSKIRYADKVQGAGEPLSLEELPSFTLVTGIAEPEPLIRFLERAGKEFDHKVYPDHHRFSASELNEISRCSCILTTEKDYMRLKDRMSHPALYYLPIEMEFLDGADGFNALIRDQLQKKMRPF